MRKKCYRFFGPLLTAQTKWLNKMSEKGFRLVRTGKLLYEFKPCTPGAYQYQVDFIADKSKENAEDYVHFLEDLGYRVFYKNINLNYAVGKIKVRPWAEPGGMIATNQTTYNRELLIVEKLNDGKPFDLHSTYEDKARIIRRMQMPWISLFLIFSILGIVMKKWIWGVFAFPCLIILIVYQIEYAKLKKLSKVKES